MLLAETYWQEGIALCEQLGLRGENAWPLDCLGFAAWCQGDMAAAERYIEAALAIYAEVGRQAHIGMCMAELATGAGEYGSCAAGDCVGTAGSRHYAPD